MQHAGIWDQVKDKIVYAENINMAKQYGTSKNADAVFTAYSLVLKEAGQVIQVDEALHTPIVQKLGVLAHSPASRLGAIVHQVLVERRRPRDPDALRLQGTLTPMKYTRLLLAPHVC